MDELIRDIRDAADVILALPPYSRAIVSPAVQLAVMAQKAADELEKRRWIPVEERLPVSGTTVCVAFDTGEVDILYQQWAEWGESGLEYIDDPAIYSTKKAMYWMEPPAPPNGLPVWGAQE